MNQTEIIGILIQVIVYGLLIAAVVVIIGSIIQALKG